jgi:hypothetical protein
MSDIIEPAITNERPNAVSAPSGWKDRTDRNDSLKTIRPKIASTIDGVPATTSIPDSTSRASQNGRAYSVSHSAMRRRAEGDRDADRRHQQRAEDRVEDPAALGLVGLEVRPLEEHGQAQLGDALDEHVEHDRRGHRAQQGAGRPAGQPADAVAARPRPAVLAQRGAHGRIP